MHVLDAGPAGAGRARRVTRSAAIGVLDVRRAEVSGAELTLATDPVTLTGLLRGTRDLGAELRADRVSATGDPAAPAAFLGLFRSPARSA